MNAHDPENYRLMSVPHESKAKLQADADAFYEDIAELRKKYKLANVIVLIETPVMINGIETVSATSLRLGDGGNELPMLAREYGAARQRFDNDLARLIAAARKQEC